MTAGASAYSKVGKGLAVFDLAGNAAGVGRSIYGSEGITQQGFTFSNSVELGASFFGASANLSNGGLRAFDGISFDRSTLSTNGLGGVHFGNAPRKGARSVAQLEKLKLQHAADEILNAQRIGSGLKPDATHRAASFLSRKQLEAGKLFPIRGGDGVQRQLLQTQGGLNGKKGIFEFILDPAGNITHQRFIDGGAITGIPNFPVRNLPR